MTVKHLYAPLLVFATGLLLSTISCQHSPILPDDGPPVDTIPDDPIDTTMNGTPCDPDLVYFDLQVLPILRSNCAKSGCHDAITHEEGVILDSYENVLATTEIKVSDPYDSDILEAIFDDKPEDRMPPPPNTPLSQEYIDLIVDWIVQGAKDLDCDPDSGGCNTDNVTFSQDVFPVMQITCIGCHSGAQPQGNLDLSTYDKIKIVANDGRLLGAIKGESGYVQMPFGGQPLPQCTIDKISAWVADGAPRTKDLFISYREFKKKEMNWINSCAVLLLLASLIFVPSCYYDNEEELYPFVECDTTAVTYTETVLPVLENNCYVCHSAAANLGGITLEGYQNLLTYVNSGRFLGAIRRQEGFSPMPQNASQLPDCTLDQIEAWINLGAPEN